MIPNKLNIGNEIRVIAPSRSLSVVRDEVFDKALKFLSDKGFVISFSKNSREIDETNSSSIQSRVEDLLQPSQQAKKYCVIQEGSCQGEIIGGNLCTLNLLQGTEFMPDLQDKILFLEDDNIMGDYFTFEFERNLQSLIQTMGFNRVKGIVFGRFDSSCNMDKRTIERIISTKKQLKNIPIIFNVDFGHVLPIATFPIGGVAKIEAKGNFVSLEIIKH